MKTSNCISCKYYTDGECYRFPPQVVAVSYNHGEDVHIESHVPAVQAYFSCGEYKEKDQDNV